MKKIIFGFLILLCSLSLIGCKKKNDKPDTPDDPGINNPDNPNDNPDTPDVKYEQPEGYPYPETHLDDGKERSILGLTIVDNGNNTIYLGDTFTAEGYGVFMTYMESDHIGTNLPSRTVVKIDNFTFDDSKVNYQKEGTYTVTFYGRVNTDFRTAPATITIKADRYEYLGVEHLFGIKCDTKVTGSVGMSKDQIKPQNVYLIYTENKYVNGELITREERTRSDYTLNTDFVDVTKAGSYPVYIECSKEYNGVKITVKAFFELTLQ